MVRRTDMHPHKRVKWFRFYTRVWPWLLACWVVVYLAAMIALGALTPEPSWLLAGALSALLGVCVSIYAALQSREDYSAFVEKVNGILIFETCNMAVQQGILHYLIQGSPAFGVIIAAGVMVAGYFLWYRLNLYYFRKRLLPQKDAQPNLDLREIALAGDSTIPSNDCFPGNVPPLDLIRDPWDTKAHFDTDSRIRPIYCSKCGQPLDRASRICTGCGKQYPRVISPKAVAIITLSILLAAALGLTAALFVQLDDQQRQITFLRDDLADAEAALRKLEGKDAEAAELQQTITGLQQKLEQLTGQIDELDDQLTSLEKKNTALQKQAEQLKAEKKDIQEQLDFFDKYVVFIANDGTNLFHTYECYASLNIREFWAYNIDAAEINGYEACPRCQK